MRRCCECSAAVLCAFFETFPLFLWGLEPRQGSRLIHVLMDSKTLPSLMRLVDVLAEAS